MDETPRNKYGHPVQYNAKKKSFWQEFPETVNILKQLWLLGTRVFDIKSVLGKESPSRSGIIAKAHRLGLPPHLHHHPSKPKAIIRRKKKAKLAALKHTLRDEPELPTVEAKDLPRDESPDACTILELNKYTCRWPMGNPQDLDFSFCGSRPLEKSPYCRRHTVVAFQKPNRDAAKVPWRNFK